MPKYNPEMSIQGMQEAQRWNARAIASLRPSGTLGRQIQLIVSQMHRYEISITHVGRYLRNGRISGGGSLRASIRMDIQQLTGKTYIDPSTVNPDTRQKPSVYGVFENARGGQHAFAERTVQEAESRIINTAIAYIGRSLI